MTGSPVEAVERPATPAASPSPPPALGVAVAPRLERGGRTSRMGLVAETDVSRAAAVECIESGADWGSERLGEVDEMGFFWRAQQTPRSTREHSNEPYTMARQGDAFIFPVRKRADSMERSGSSREGG